MQEFCHTSGIHISVVVMGSAQWHTDQRVQS